MKTFRIILAINQPELAVTVLCPVVRASCEATAVAAAITSVTEDFDGATGWQAESVEEVA